MGTETSREAEERRHGAAGEPAGSKGIQQGAEGRESSRGLDPISATSLVGSVMHAHLPRFVQMCIDPMYQIQNAKMTHMDPGHTWGRGGG